MKVEPVIVAGPWRLYPDSMQVGFRLKLDRVQLNKMEFRILREFATNQQRVLSREELLKAVGDNKRRRDSRTVDACLSQLRRKLEEDPENPTFLFGDSRNGYVFSLDASWRSRQRRLGQNNGRRGTRQRKPGQRTKPKASRASRRKETTVFQNRILDPIPLKPKTDLERLIESAL